MKAYTYIEKGRFELMDKPKPTIQEPTDAIVRVTLSSICTSDLHIKHGNVPRAVPGNRPYKQGGKVPQPKGRRGCNRCGVCAKQCPADAIPLSDPKTVDTAKCISCMKCVSVCPTGARGIGVVMNFLATQGLKKVCATRKENEMYI